MKTKDKGELMGRYRKAKNAKVGETFNCPCCDTSVVKTNYQQAFCGTRNNTVCKDYYWNNVTETKRNNTTRISPANAAWKQNQEDKRELYEDFDDDMSWDAHKSY